LIATPLESVTLIEKMEEPLDEGTPATMPFDDNVSPTGNDPELSVHVYGGVPPVSPVTVNNDAVYEIPTVPFGSTTGALKVSGDAVHEIVMVTRVPGVADSADAGIVPERRPVVEL